MKKVFFIVLSLLMISVPTFAADTLVEALKGLNDWNSIVSIVLGILSLVFGGFLVIFKKKLRQAGELLIAFADAVENDKIDANEKVDLATKAKELFSKKVETK